MDAATEIGSNLVSKHQVQPDYGDEQADAGRDGGIRLARPNSQARKGTGKTSFSLFSLETFWRWDVSSNLGAVTNWDFFS